MPRLNQPGARVIRLAIFPEGADYNHENPPLISYLFAANVSNAILMSTALLLLSEKPTKKPLHTMKRF